MTVRLTGEEYAMLERAAQKAGLKPAVYARSVIKRELNQPGEAVEDRRDAFLKVVREMEALSKKYSWPDVDFVKLIREGRDERSILNLELNDRDR